MTSEKRALREAVRSRAAEGTPADDAGGTVATAVLALPEVQAARVVAAYLSLRDEIPTDALLDRLRAGGREVLVPALRADRGLDWRALRDDAEVEPGLRGTRQPPGPARELAEAQVVVVPAVAVDSEGRRLGRGGGSYDRALTEVLPGTLIVALVHDHAVVAEVPAEAHDVRVDVVVTPTRVLRTPPPAPNG